MAEAFLIEDLQQLDCSCNVQFQFSRTTLNIVIPLRYTYRYIHILIPAFSFMIRFPDLRLHTHELRAMRSCKPRSWIARQPAWVARAKNFGFGSKCTFWGQKVAVACGRRVIMASDAFHRGLGCLSIDWLRLRESKLEEAARLQKDMLVHFRSFESAATCLPDKVGLSRWQDVKEMSSTGPFCYI